MLLLLGWFLIGISLSLPKSMEALLPLGEEDLWNNLCGLGLPSLDLDPELDLDLCLEYLFRVPRFLIKSGDLDLDLVLDRLDLDRGLRTTVPSLLVPTLSLGVKVRGRLL